MCCQKVEKKSKEKENISLGENEIQLPKMECQNKCENCQKKQDERERKALKKIALPLSLLLISSFTSFAQETSSTSKTFWDDPINSPMFPIYLVGTFVVITIILTLIVAFVMLRVLNVFIQNAAKEKAQRTGIVYTPAASWWSKFWDRANVLVPLEEEKNIELDHNYDGIKELDNHLPPWWKGLFYGSIVFALIYMGVYHLTDTLPLSLQEYQNEITKAEDDLRILKASQPAEVVDEKTLLFTKDATIIGRGKLVFMSSNCGSCHRADGGGNSIGPNLTDEYWLHGGEIGNVFSTIKNGVVEKAMPAWGKVMSQKDVRDVAFYVMSLQGSNPPNAKSPQGTLFKQRLDSLRLDTLKIAANRK